MNDVEVISSGIVEVAIAPTPVIEVEVESTSPIEIEVLPGGISYGGVLSLEYQLVLGRLVNQPSLHKIYSYSGGNLTAITVYNDADLTTQLLSISLSYTGSNLTQKVLTDLISDKTLTISYGYTGSNLTSTTEVFS